MHCIGKVCISQRSKAVELATTTERLQVGGGYTYITSYEALAKLIRIKKGEYT